MNRKTLTLLLFISYSITNAQYKGGMELGGNLMQADFIFDEPIETTNSWGIRLGYVAEFEVTDHFYLRGALLINQRGF